MPQASLKALFGHNHAQQRQAKDLTQEELAEACGVTANTISFIERGIHGPRFDLLERLVDVLEVSAATLFEE